METNTQTPTAPPIRSTDSLGDGNELYHRAICECDPDHRELMGQVWSPTPWMTDVVTECREHKIWHWCYHQLGPESSPIHNKEGGWHRGNVTMRGRTWYGFKSEAILKRFAAQFPPPNH